MRLDKGDGRRLSRGLTAGDGEQELERKTLKSKNLVTWDAEIFGTVGMKVRGGSLWAGSGRGSEGPGGHPRRGWSKPK